MGSTWGFLGLPVARRRHINPNRAAIVTVVNLKVMGGHGSKPDIGGVLDVVPGGRRQLSAWPRYRSMPRTLAPITSGFPGWVTISISMPPVIEKVTVLDTALLVGA